MTVEEQLEHLRHSPFNASVEYWLKTGTLSGSFKEAIDKIAQQQLPTDEQIVIDVSKLRQLMKEI